MEPIVEQMELPPDYGSPDKLLAWETVRKELEEAPQYWIASTRPDGRPHVVPRDGIWFDDTLYYGGSPDTVHNRNVDTNPFVVAHIGDGLKAIIVEGEVRLSAAPQEVAQKVADESNRKYAHYGLNTTADMYTSGGALALKARRVLAWTNLPENATRFLF